MRVPQRFLLQSLLGVLLQHRGRAEYTLYEASDTGAHYSDDQRFLVLKYCQISARLGPEEVFVAPGRMLLI